MTDGIPTHLRMVRKGVGLGVVSWATLMHLVGDPRVVERQLKSRPELLEAGELRAQVQRAFKTNAKNPSTKARNVTPYAAYIAAGIRGDLGTGWSTPPLTLWSPADLSVSEDGWMTLPLGVTFIAVDAETQLAALHLIWSDPTKFALTRDQLRDLNVSFELYWGIGVPEARQIFHDRNRFGVPVDKTLAMGMDTRDIATEITHRFIATTLVTVHGVVESLSTYVATKRNSIGQNDPEWVTLSAMRTLIICTVFGTRGIPLTSGNITNVAELPGDANVANITDEVTEVLGPILQRFAPAMSRRSALARPGVLSGLGAVAHHALSWCTTEPKLSLAEVMDLLEDIHWDGDPHAWDGIAATTATDGRVKWSNGVKDVGRKSYEAMIDPTCEAGLRIRGE